MADNKLYFGDNLDILYRYVSDESLDLIYLDPPFKSSQDYNILFAEQNGTRHPRLQILTIAELFEGTNIDRPPLRRGRNLQKSPARKTQARRRAA